MRDWKAASSALVSSVLCLLLGVPEAGAGCLVCDPFLHCLEQFPGARVCVEAPGACSMLFPCLVGGGRVSDGDDGALLTLSLFEGGASATTALETDAGALALGAPARGTSGQARGPLAAAMLAHGEDYAVWFSDPGDGGFIVQRQEAGGTVHLEVREVVSGAEGRVLASALLLPQDRLRVPVTVEGRAHVLVLQADHVSRARLASEQARLRRALEQAGRELPVRPRPLLQPRPR